MRRSVMGCHVKSMHYDYSGKLSASKYPNCVMLVFPKFTRWPPVSFGVSGSPKRR
jgi:hypothetical protein